MKRSRLLISLMIFGLLVLLFHDCHLAQSLSGLPELSNNSAQVPPLIAGTPGAKRTVTPLPTTIAQAAPAATAVPVSTPTRTPVPSPMPEGIHAPGPTELTGVSLGLASLHAQLRGDPELKAAFSGPDQDIKVREGEVIVPVLLYHFVGRDTLETGGMSTTRYNVTLEDFRTQLALFDQAGYQTVTISEVSAALRGEGELPGRPLAITVDDGWAEQYTHIFSSLQAFGMRATFYIPSSYPVGGRLVTWEQLQIMVDAGMEIGSHTRSHVDLTDLDAMSLRNELVASKLVLEDKLGITVESISYPFGQYSSAVIQATQAAGYRSAVALGPLLRQSADRLYAINRVEVYGTRPLLDLVQRLPWLGQESNLCLQPIVPEPYR